MADTESSPPTFPYGRAHGGDGAAGTAAHATVRRASPLEPYAGRFAAGSGDVGLREVPFLAQAGVRLDPAGAAAQSAAGALGVALPIEPNTVSRGADVEVVWLGPDEWLVVGADGTREKIAARLREQLDERVVSVVDVSAQRTVIEVSGLRAREVLARGCSLDLHPSAFPAGRCAQTLLARAGVLLVARVNGHGREPVFWVFVRASFAAYLAEWLLDARGG